MHELAKRLTSRFDVVVLGPHAPGALPAECMDGVQVVRYRYAPERLETLVNDGGIVTNLKRSTWKLLLVPTFVLVQAWMARRLVREHEIDVIHAHWLVPQGLIAALAGRRRPFIVTSHGADLYALRGAVLNALKRFVVARASSVTVVSSAMLDSLSCIGADTRKASVLSMGVDVSGRFKPDATVARSPDEILFVGRLVEKKGVGHLIRALPGVLARRPTVRLTIAGFGPYEPQLRAEAMAVGVADKIDFLGALPQAELPRLYCRAAVFVAPFVRAGSGDQEGLPVALMEAIACGCPILAGNVAGLHDMLGEHAAAVVFDPHDEVGLASRIVATLSDPAVAVARALRMSAYVRETFDWDSIAARYGEVLDAALAGTSFGRGS